MAPLAVEEIPSRLKPLSRRFYARPTLEVARELIGRTIRSEGDGEPVVGRIVEVEAYGGGDDPGSHAFRGRRMRNDTMFGPPGHLYVYFTYGMHYCSNVVCESDGIPGAVLIRAAEPLEGQELMAARRKVDDPRLLARGPARFCQAFGIDMSLNGSDLITGPVTIGGRSELQGEIKESPRVGISSGHELNWRIYEAGPWSSRGRVGPRKA